MSERTQMAHKVAPPLRASLEHDPSKRSTTSVARPAVHYVPSSEAGASRLPERVSPVSTGPQFSCVRPCIPLRQAPPASGGCSPVLDGNPLTGTDEYVIRVLIRQAKPQHHFDCAGNVRPNLNIDLARPDDRWSNVDREFGRQRSCSSGQQCEPREAGKMRSIDHGAFTLEIRDQMSAREAV